MAKKLAKPSKKAKKVVKKAKPRKIKVAIKKRIQPPKRSPNFKRAHDLFASKLVSSKLKNESLPILTELLYNLTPSTRNIGYTSGFNLGVRLSELHNSSNTIHPLLNVLENAGFSNVLYYPQKSSAVIEATHHQDCKMNLDATLHIFESGIIAGYISHSTGSRMSVVETRCAHGAVGKCQFVIEGAAEINAPNAFEGTDQISSSIASAATMKIPGVIPILYFALSIAPLTKSPLREQLSKLLFIVGEGLSKELIQSDNSIQNLSLLFALDKVEIKRKGKSIRSLVLEFKKGASTSEYTQLILPFFSGLLYGEHKKLARISSSLGKAGSYISELKI